MNKTIGKYFGWICMLCLLVSLLPAVAFAQPAEVALDLGAPNTVNENYTIADTYIILHKSDVVYVLSGTTSKMLHQANGVSQVNIKLNGAVLNGTIDMNSYGRAAYAIEVAAGTNNTVQQMSPYSELSIYGEGTLNTTLLTTGGMGKSLTITDTTLNIDSSATNASNAWEGAVTIGGTAEVTILGNELYPPLKLGQNVVSPMVLQDQAKLKSTPKNPATPNAGGSTVSGIQIWKAGSTLTLKDSSYLETEGKNSTNGYLSNGLSNDEALITVEDNATLKVKSYGEAILAGGGLNILGGSVQAESVYMPGIWATELKVANAKLRSSGPVSYSIYVPGDISISNAEVESTGAWGGLSAGQNLSIANSKVTAMSTGGYYGVYCYGKMDISGNSDVKATGVYGMSEVQITPASGRKVNVKYQNEDTHFDAHGILSPLTQKTTFAGDALNELMSSDYFHSYPAEPEPQPQPPQADVPTTGDSANLLLWTGMMVMALLGGMALVARKRRQEN